MRPVYTEELQMPVKKPKPLTRLVARYVKNVRYNDVPERILLPLRQSLVDTAGCGVLGSTTRVATLMRDYVDSWKSSPEATIWGTPLKASVPFAAMANCAASHAWDFDDTIMPAVLHPGSVAVPTALAIAEHARTAVSGKALLTAIAAGYEVGNVVGTALGSKAFASGGFYNSVPTIFVAVATAAKLMNLSEEETVRALGMAATQSAGLYSATLTKRINAPKAVLGGIFAAELARRGLEAPADGLEAEYSGFLGTFSRSPEPDVIPRDLGRYRFEIFHKIYPCIRSNHPSVENIKLLLEEHPEIKTSAIRKIVSHVDQLTVDYTVKTTAGGSEGVNTPGNALVSFQYCVAAMAVDRELTLRQFTPRRVKDPRIQQLMRKIHCVADPSIDKLPATKRYRCTVDVYLENGTRLKRFLAGPKGDPNNRLTAGEMFDKFQANTNSALPQRQTTRLFNFLRDIERQPDVRKIGRLLATR